MKKFRYFVGRILGAAGYHIERSHKRPVVTLNLLLVAFSALLRVRKRIRVLQIGAYDGLHADPINACLERYIEDVEAILVEPQPEVVSRLRNRWEDYGNIVVEAVAISDKDGSVKMWRPLSDRDSSPWASLDPLHRRRFGLSESEVEEIEVPAVTISTLLHMHQWDHCDVMQVDAEGQDFSIVKQAIESGYRPTIINLESWHLCKWERDAMLALLAQEGYKIADWSRDTLAIRVDGITSVP